MGNVSIFQRFRRRLTKNSSGTVSVSIPLEYVYKLGWDKGDYVDVELRENQLIIVEAPIAKKGSKK